MDNKIRAWQIGDYELTAEEISDIIWLASFIDSFGKQHPPLKTIPSQPHDLKATAEEVDSTGQPSPTDNEERILPEKPEPKGEHPEDASGHLLTPDPGSQDTISDSGPDMSGVKFPTPRPSALLEKLSIMRSLRPLLQPIPSTTEFDINEEETAARIADADGGVWIPVLQPVQERPFDLVLLIDRSPSMAVWEQTVKELRLVLIQTGIFRLVRSWYMVMEEKFSDGDQRSTTMSLQVADRYGTAAKRTFQPRELIDPLQRRLFLVLSDCSSAAWDNGSVTKILNPLAKLNVVTILQLLPESLWDTTALTNAVYASLSARDSLVGNNQLNVEKLEQGWSQKEVAGFQAFPVISFSPASLSRWAKFLMGRGQEKVLGYFFLPEDFGEDYDLEAELLALGITESQKELSVEERYRYFRGTVPPLSRRLAAYMAAAPLTLPVMRMVQETMLKESTHADFVRVFYSGLIERKTLQEKGVDADSIRYDFVGGEEMRHRLLETIPRYKVEEVKEKVFEALSRYISEHTGQLDVFYTILHVPGATGDLALDAKTRQFAEVYASVLRFLGGGYEQQAERLEAAMKPTPPPVQTDGIRLWMSASLPETVVVGDVVSLSIQISSPQQSPEMFSLMTDSKYLGEFPAGTQLQINVGEALYPELAGQADEINVPGNFVLLNDTTMNYVVEDEMRSPSQIVSQLQANSLGKVSVTITFSDISNRFDPMYLSCEIVPVESDPVNSLTVSWDGDDAFDSGNFAKAESKYTEAIMLGENNAHVYRFRGLARHELAMDRQAEADYNAAFNRGFEDYWILIDRGNVRARQGKLTEAISDFKKAIKIDPNLENAYIGLGHVYMNQGNLIQAVAEYTKFIELKPEDANGYNSRGNAYKELAENEKAMADYNRAIETDPNYMWAYYNRGNLYRNQEKYQEAIIDLNQALEIDKNYASAYNARGIANKDLGHDEAALADYTRAIEIDPKFKWGYYNRGDLYSDRGEYQKAITQFTQALAIDQTYADAYTARGFAYGKLGNDEAALADYARAIDANPDDEWTYYTRGDLYRKRGEYQEAINEFNRALEIRPTYASAYNARGLAYQELAADEAALADFARAIEADAKFKWAYYNRGLYYHDRKDYKLAITEFNQALEIDETYAVAYNARGLAYEKLGINEAALAEYASAIEADTKFKWAYANRGRLLQKLGNINAAEKELLDALQNIPEDGFTYNELGILYSTAGRFDDSRQCFERAIIGYSRELESDENYDLYCNRGGVNENLFRWEQALEDYTNATRLRPNKADAHTRRGGCYLEMQAYDEAIANYSRGIELEPRHATAHFDRAIAYFSKKDYRKALELVEQAIDLHPSNAYGPMIRGLIYARIKDYNSAVRDANAAIDMAQDNNVVYGFCCAIYLILERYDESIKYGEHAISLEPNETWILTSLGHNMLLMGQIKMAREYYQRAIDQRPDRFFWQATIDEINDLLQEHPKQSKIGQQCIKMFEEAMVVV